ncbi:MAG: CoA transferase [Clostridia bacterium]|nr:CoA transferase [Clostridia bacterium]
MSKSILDGIVVLDLADASGVYCSALLARMGARVVRPEPPEGSDVRRIGPFADGVSPACERSLFHAAFNAGKESVILPEDDTDTLRALLARCDVVIDTSRKTFLGRYGLSHADFVTLNPCGIAVSITPFGLSGPFSDWHAASDTIAFAMGGPMFENGKPDYPPLQYGYHLLSSGASIYAATGVIAALYARAQNGDGRFIEVTLQETGAAWRSNAYGRAQLSSGAESWQRLGSQGIMIPSNFFRCKDGFVFMMASGRWSELVQWMQEKGLDTGDWTDPKYLDNQGMNAYLWADIDHVNEMIGRLSIQYTKQEMMLEGQRRNVPCGTAETAASVLTNPHFQARGVFCDMRHPLLGTLRYPSVPIAFSEEPCLTGLRAPLLGEHAGTLRALLDAPTKPMPAKKARAASLPLAGVRVLDLSWVIAGPHGNRILQDLGATVIKLESSSRLDPMRIDTARTGVKDFLMEGGYAFQDNNRDKLGLRLNLKSAAGYAILEKLVAQTDVVTCNYAPKGFHKLGLGFESLRRFKKDIIVVNASGLGDYGPYSAYATFAPILQAMTGLTSLMGYEGEDPYGFPLLLADYVGGQSLALAVVAALEYRRRTGKGQFVDLSQAESVLCCMGPMLLDYQLSGKQPKTVGNRHYLAQIAPHNCYACRDANTWCFVAAGNDEEWAALRGALLNECPAIADTRFDTLAGRLRHQEPLDAIIAGWMKRRQPLEAAKLLQAAGVSAAPVDAAMESLQDENLLARGFFTPIHFSEDDDIQPKELLISERLIHLDPPPKPHRAAPAMGEHNDYILRRLLGLSEEEIAQAAAQGAFR